MMREDRLPESLDQLFAAADPEGPRAVSVPLPPGRLVLPHKGSRPASWRFKRRPAYWLSDGPAPKGMWAQLHAEHARSGLWPLLLGGLEREPQRPWETGEINPARMSSPAGHDPAAVLAGWWAGCTQDADEEDPEGELTAPFGRRWPGLAAPGTPRWTPALHADGYADVLADGSWRLGLVAADRGADALTVAGWTGPVHHAIDTGEISAVVRDWEDRFGVRVVAVGFAILHLSVAAPPVDLDHAIQVAAEHFAFCPDKIRQGAETLSAYADELLGAPTWSFWWD